MIQTHKIIIILICFALLPALAFGASLAWDAPASGTPDGYHLKYAEKAGGPYETFATVNALKYDLTGPIKEKNWTGKTLWFVVTAFNKWGESDNSNEVTDTISPAERPVRLRFEIPATLIFTE